MTSSLAHRGPDASGHFAETFDQGQRCVVLGHTRLAIIDLAGGEQPMHSECGRLHLVFNGEVYNYQELRVELAQAGHAFRTDSDTEVLLHALLRWGDGAFGRLRGMFALALWDSVEQTLLLARDRYGEKPLHYAVVNGELLFASELRALCQWPGFDVRLDREALPLFLQFRYTPAPLTLLEGVRKLMPGCFATWSNGRVTHTRYYTPPDAQPGADSALLRPIDVREAAGAFRNALDDSVASMMRSDVPFGAFLSGGIDSSAIVGLMARHSNVPIRTFSVGFEEAGYSELSAAERVASHFGTDHHALTVSNKSVQSLLVDAVASRDAPVSEPADLPMLALAREARRSVKMVLTGEGSDEALGGYPKHLLEGRIGAIRAIPAPLRNALLGPLLDALPFASRRTRIAAAALRTESFDARMPRWFGALSCAEVEALVGLAPSINGCAYPFQSNRAASPLRRVLFFDQTSWLPDNLLERGDRMTMAASLEARMPFMDHRLIELASALPDHLRVHGMCTKVILRKAMHGLLPDFVLRRPKVGFSMPVATWLRRELQPLVGDALLGADSLCGRLMNRQLLRGYVDGHLSGRRSYDKPLWMLLNLELWARHMRLSA